MTSELVDVDLGSIRDEELLRRMWLQTEDFGRKKQIRARMYKLREQRLREFYVTGEMDSSNIGITKAPLTPSHGESIADQSFQSFKTKEIRDSASPTHELKYTRGGVIVPDTSGWNVVTSSEVSPDGKSYKTETLASTEGTQKITGGHSQFSGKNEHKQSASHQGNDKNFVKTANEKSNTQLQEKIVVGDENNGRVEQKSSSVVSSSHVTTSKQSSYGPDAALDHRAVISDFDQLVDSAMPATVHRDQQQEHQQRSEKTVRQERQVKEYQHQEERQHQQKHSQQTQNERYVVEDTTNQANFRSNQTHTNEVNQSEQIRRKLIQEEVDLLAAAPGKIISRTVDYPDPNTKVITETKTLPDGTTVTTRKFETKSAKSKTWSSSSNQKESTSSRTIVEDRAQRNRVEYVVDGKEKLISDDYNVRRITGRGTPQDPRDTGRETENKHQTKEEVFTSETTQQKQVHDRTDQKVYNTVTRQDKIFQDELRKDTRYQDNVKRTGNIPTERAEKFKDQAEVLETDAVHKTVKKDLSQKVHDSKLTSQDFIQTEKGCSMIDHSRIVPEKYITEPKADSTETRIHVSRTQTEQHDNRGCVDVSRESVREQSIKHQQRPDYPESSKKPSQDYTTQGFPSVRPDSTTPYKRDQDFTTQGFPSVKSHKPDEYSPSSKRPIHDTTYSSPDRQTSTTTQTFATQNVEQTQKSQQITQSSEQKTVTRQSNDFTTHGFPSIAPERVSPIRKPEDQKQRILVQPDRSTQTIHETRQTVEERTVNKAKDDFTEQGFPSTRPERDSQPTPSERSLRQPIDKPRKPNHPEYSSQTIQVHQVQQQSTDQRTTRQNTVQDYSSIKPDTRSPSTPHEGSPQQLLEKPNEPRQQQTVEKHIYTESRQTVVDRDQDKRDTYYPDGSHPSKDPPQKYPKDYTHEPNKRYPHEPCQRYPKESNQRHTQEPSQRHPQEPDQRHPREPSQRYPQEPGQRYPQESTQRYPQERYPTEEPTEKYPQKPVQTYLQEPIRSEYPPEKVPRSYAKQPSQTPATKDTGKSTHVTEIRTTTQQVKPDQVKEPYPSTYEGMRPDQPYRPDGDDGSSVTTERTDISDITRKNRKDFLQSTRVTVEVDAAHDAFARSLRCVSPVDQTRGSVKSLKSTTSSVRSSYSPDKRSHRSPSHESDTSKFSTSTITRSKDSRDSVKKSTSPKKKSPLKDRLSPSDRSYPRDQQNLYKLNESADVHRRSTKKDEFITLPNKKPKVIHSPEDKKASRYPNSVNEVSMRPETYPTRPVDSSRVTQKKPDSRPTLSDEFPTSPTKKGPKSSPIIQTDRRTSSDTTKSPKFTKTVKVDNAILRDDTTPKQPGKPQNSDDEGFEPESTRSGSPSFLKRFKELPQQTTDLDSTDITVEVNLKNVGRNVDLFTTITDTDGTKKSYKSEDSITRERDGTEKTTTVERTDKNPEKETYYPTETGEPFYLISTDQQKPKGGKEKPPLNRSETYEERCRQILGMNQTLKDKKTTKSAVTEDFITTERIVQEKDKAGKIPSPVPSPRSSSPRKQHTPTVVDNVTIIGKVQTHSPDQSPTRKSKGPDSSGYTTPKDSPAASPYSSLSRKSTPRNTPIDSPYTRSPTTSPTRKSLSTSPQRPVSRDSMPRKLEFDDSEITTSSRFVEKTTHDSERDLAKRSSIRKSPSPGQSPERRPFRESPRQSPERRSFRESPRQSPERFVSSSITVERKTNEDRRTVDSTTKPVRKEPYKTEVCYEVTKPRSRSPSGSPRRKAPYELSPRRDQFSVTENKYISTTSRTNKEELKDIDETRRTRTTKTTHVKDVPGTTRYGISSPTRRPQPEELKSVPKKTTTLITSRITTVKTPTNQRSTPTSTSTPRKPASFVPSSSPLKVKNLPSRPSTLSPSRRSAFPPDSTTETSRRTKTDYSTVKTTKTSTTTTEDQASHVTTAKIQLSPTLTRKISSPGKKTPKQPELKNLRPTPTALTKVTKPAVPRSSLRDQPEKVQPLRRPDVKKPQETTTIRKRIEKHTVNVEDESDSSVGREKEEVTIIRQTREMPITIVGKTLTSKKTPVTERKESAPIYGTRSVKETTQKMNRSTSDNVLKTSTVRETRSQFDKNLLGPEDKPKRRDSTDKPHGKSERRPSKHLATKTINLSAPTGIILNSEDMENVIIDIQQAKSSREPSPNKIIPTPVPLDEYTGKPRYPDTVQEPEEEPRRKPKVKNIPIFEEETNNFVGCYITEVDETVQKKTQKRTTEVSDDETVVKTVRNQKISRESSPHKEPKYLPDGSVVDDECLLSVHDKVNKFINTAEEIKKPKTSSPFKREIPSEQIPERDDCLLSVNAKVNKFSTTTEGVTKTPRKSPPKQIGRPNIDEIDEDLRTDECILSVSEKVNKFINTAEKLVSPVPQRSPELVAKVERQISRQSDESDREVVTKNIEKTSDREIVTKNIEKTSTVTDRYTGSVGKKTGTDKPASPKPTLKSSAAIQKAKQVFENGSTTTPRQRDILSRPSVWEGRKQVTDEVRLEDIGVYKKHGKDTEEIFDKAEHISSKSPTRNVDTYPSKPLKSSGVLKDTVSSKKDLFETRTTSKTNVTTSETTTSRTSDNVIESRTERRSTGDYSRYSPSPSRYYPDDHSPSRYSKESETISRRSKEVSCINRSGSPQSKRYSQPDSPKKPSQGRDGSPFSKDHSHRSHVTTDSVTAKCNLFEKTENAHLSHTPPPAGPRPSYMDHTMSSLEHIRRDSVEVNKNYIRKASMDSTSTHEYDGSPRSGTKFGVELKRTDSKGEKLRRRSSSAEIPHIEEIFDLELLEQMLHTVTGYEHRRRIRSQIRVVKKMIETQNRDASHTEYIRIVKEERSSSRGSSPSPDRVYDRRTSPSRKESFKSSSSRFIETESRHTSREVKKEVKDRNVSPHSKMERLETIRQVKRTGEKPKSVMTKQVRDEKPIWATKNILKKATQNDQSKSVATKRVTSTTSSKTQTRRQKIEAEEDSVISCYGIGPTDEDGRPLFGIRALQKRNKPSETKKVTGTVITEKYYSENGAQPIGERKVTVYSSSPDDVKKIESKLNARPTAEMIKRERSSKDGITTMTRVEKISKTRDAEEQDIPTIAPIETKDLSAQPAKIVRKGSVKEITEKYIRKTSTSSMSEKSNRGDYPKAGLILRTQSHINRGPGSGEFNVSDSGSYYDSGDESANLDNLSTDKNGTIALVDRNSSEFSSSSKSFLNSSGTKVTGVNDILDRMRNADNVVEDGDNAEDKEARSLLNKFLGASILMTGMDSMVSNQIASSGVDPTIKREELKTSDHTKTLTKEGSSAPVEQKTCDFEDIRDLEILKQLLEKSKNYEERRRIRARIRQVMAEREACADKVAQLRKGDEGDSDEESSSSEYEEIEEIIEEEVEEEVEEEEQEEKGKLEVEEEDSEEEILDEKHASEAVDKVETKPEEKTMRSTCSKKEEISDDIGESREVQGESLLLPLLQGLLHKNNTPQVRPQTSKEVSNKLISCKSAGSIANNSKSNAKPPQLEKLGSSHTDTMHSIHHVEDSGTESGEDLKFIAAGLRDSMQIHSQGDSDLIAEVTAALNRLEHSLKEGNDLKMEDSKKNALLTLVGRLQTGLKSPEKITAPTPAPGQVAGDDNDTSSPEADARRNSRPGHQRFAKRRNRASRHTVGVSREELADARRYIEEMVMMENMSNCTTPESSTVTPPEFVSPFEKSRVKTDTQESSALYRPNQFVPSHLKDSQINHFNNPPVQMRDKKEPKNPVIRQSANVEQTNPLPTRVEEQRNQRPLSDSYDYQKSQPPANYQIPKQEIYQPNVTANYLTAPEHGQDVYDKNVYNKTHHSPQLVYDPVFNGLRPSAYTTDNAETNKQSRFVNKKLLMKRANTIDIPKPMKYLHDMESDSEAEERGICSTKSIGLRGTVQVSVNSKPRQVVPPFKPKTENDHKFLAFIQKTNPSQGLGWNNPNRTVSNWSNKFGNIKNAFESGAVATSGKPPVPTHSARNFWKKTDLAPSQNEKIVKPPWAERGGDVLAGALKAKQKIEKMEAIAPKAEHINKFSHAPLSAFKPVEPAPVYQAQFQPITPPPHHSATSWPVFSNPPQITTTKLSYSGRPLTSSSPTLGLPWATNPNSDHRVLSMAASKFESKSPTSGLQRHGSLREQDQIYQQRIASYNEAQMDRKRPSLPNATQYNPEAVGPAMVQNYQNISYNDPRSGPYSQTYTSTDYTDPSVSTFYPERQMERRDSLTNPQSEPLVLSSSRPIISPNIGATQPQQPLKIFDYPSSPESVNQTLNDITDDELDSNSLREYTAEAKVMKGPVGQQATVTNRTNHVKSDEKFGRNSKAANNLLLVMKNISNGKSPDRKMSNPDTKLTPQSCISPDGSSYQAPHVEPIFPNLTNTPTNRMPEYIPKPGNNIPYQSQQSVQSTTSSRGFQSQPSTPHSQIIPGITRGLQSQPTTPQSQTVPISLVGINSQPSTPQSQMTTGGYHPLSPGYKMPQMQPTQATFIPYQSQPPAQCLPGSQVLQPTTPQSPHHPNGFSQQNPIYVPQPPHPSKKPSISSKPQGNQQTTASAGVAQYQQAQYRQQNIQQMSQQSQIQKYQTQGQYQPTQTVPTQMKDQKQHPIVPQQSSKSQPAYTQPKETPKPQQRPIALAKPTPLVGPIAEKITSKAVSKKPVTQAQSQTASKVELKRQQATEMAYKERKKEIEVSTKISSANQMVTTSSTTVQKKVSVNEETQVYKSSAPTDTPDIVKSSLAKEDFPILKKFGPPQRHCYMPNAYQNPLSKSGSTANARIAQPAPMSRKFSEPSVITKFVAPEIIETPSTPVAAKDEIPSNIVFKNIAQFTSMARRSFDSVETTSSSKFASVNARSSPLSKSDSWHQIVQQQNSQKPPSPKSFAYPEGNALRRVKSGHTLAIPKMFEAGIDKKEVVEKQKTVAAYFSGQKSPNSLSRNSSQTNIAEMAEATKAISSVTVRKSTINRVKTTEKTSTSKPTGGLCRSQTMPHIELCTTQTTERKEEIDGDVVTTTTKVTTRTVAAPSKPISPFAKFRQLDKQQSLQNPNSPVTPTTPGGMGRGAPLFKFTDPSLNARAATAKEQLLYWCQMKTKEYENVQITNFSASWTDGLAFCALIHHFLPDAFDYSKLTPQQRRHNFELAFRVADEKAGIAPLLDVEDMVVMKRPDWKCVFTYVQSIYRRFRNSQ